MTSAAKSAGPGAGQLHTQVIAPVLLLLSNFSLQGAFPEAGEGLGSGLCALGRVTPPLCAAPFPTARQGPGERRVHLSYARYLKTDFTFLVLHAKHPASSLIPQVRSCQRPWLLAPVPAVCAQAVEASELHPARQTGSSPLSAAMTPTQLHFFIVSFPVSTYFPSYLSVIFKV